MLTDLLPYLVATGAAAPGSTTLTLNVGDGGGWPVLPGDTVVVSGGAGGAIPTGVTDSRGHAYSPVNSRTANTPEAWQFIATATNGLCTANPSNSNLPDTMVITYAGTTSAKCVVVMAVSGCPIAGVDVVQAAGNGTGTTNPSVTSAALAGVGQNEIAIALLVDANAGGVPSWPAGWNVIGSAQQGTNPFATVATQITQGTGAVTASATITSAAWSMLILVLKPQAVAQGGLVGASAWNYPDTDVRAGPGLTVANEFDGYTGRKMANQAQRTYFEENAWPAAVTAKDFKLCSDNGIFQVLTFRPLRAVGGGISSELTKEISALYLFKNYIASRGAGNAGFCVTLWHEMANSGQHGPFGDGTQQNSKFLPSPFGSSVTLTQTGINYQQHVAYYGPTIQQAGIALAFTPAVISPAAALVCFPGRALCNAYLIDYYTSGDYYPTKHTEITDCITQASGTMAGYIFSPKLPVGLGEWGRVNGPNQPTSAQFDDWCRNHVVAPLVSYMASGGYLVWMTWFYAGSGNVINASTPALEIAAIQYVYDQLNAATGPVITTASLLAATAGTAYTQTLTATGGNGTLTWAAVSGFAAAGLSLSSAGVITGTPTIPNTTYSLTFKVTDSIGQSDQITLTLTVNTGLSILTGAIPDSVAGFIFSFEIVAGGGTQPYAFSILSGAPAPGTGLSAEGVLSGTPTGLPATYTFQVKVTDSLGATATHTFDMNVLAPPPPSFPKDPVSVTLMDGNLTPMGVIPFETLQATLMYNYVDSWQMTVPYADWIWNVVSTGTAVVVVNWMGLFEFGGKVEIPGYSDSVPQVAGSGPASGASTAPGPMITLAGADYLALIANRIAFPAPASVWASQTATSVDAYSGPCESVIKSLVSKNAGPAANAGRIVTLMDIAPDLARGGAVTYNVKFTSGVDLNLLDIIRSLIATGGPMGVSLKRNGNRLVFDCFAPNDLTQTAWFSKDLGNLTSVALAITDPTCTIALVQSGATPAFSSSSVASDQWSRVEQYVDQTSQTVAAQATQAGQDALSSGQAGPTLAVTTTDTPSLTFGRDYWLGDKVTVEPKTGDTYTDIVTSVSLVVDPNQTPAISILPQIGYASDPGAADPGFAAQLLSKVKSLERRLNAQIG